ncbi:hypothetical protein PF008_g25830 [Phytophthora fragariae]|uniref:Uncharacterized protein n=1 Tax=Phytophthora fragariae TaxID=53985 RepID=A0A6G0QIU4_9STRA|nr:hypothetical protein PF008_g25830 [Phytophthora fragariae]
MSRALTAVDAKTAFKGVVIPNNNYMRDTTEGFRLRWFGRLYITNPGDSRMTGRRSRWQVGYNDYYVMVEQYEDPLQNVQLARV